MYAAMSDVEQKSDEGHVHMFTHTHTHTHTHRHAFHVHTCPLAVEAHMTVQ